MKTINLEIPAIPDNIRMIESFIDNAKESFHMDEDIYGNVMISVTEAVNNAICHGCKSDPSRSVMLSMMLEQNAVRFRIKDGGPGFDISKLPDPTTPENIEKPAGRGIFLMRHLADEVSFHDNGSTVELCFYNVNG